MTRNKARVSPFEEFKKEAPALFENWTIRKFFDDAENINLFDRFISSKDLSIKKKLDDKFRKFFFEVRFTKYLNSTIKYGCIDRDRRRRKHQNRNLLIFDKPIEEGNNDTLGDLLLLNQNPYEDQYFRGSSEFHAHIENEKLYEAFTNLTQKQKMIATLSYFQCLLDTEIASMLCISTQAVSKTKKSVLKKLKSHLNNLNS